jgi:hypothetical protein
VFDAEVAGERGEEQTDVVGPPPPLWEAAVVERGEVGKRQRRGSGDDIDGAEHGEHPGHSDCVANGLEIAAVVHRR